MRLGADVVINPRNENIVERVMEETDGLGADVAIEAVGSPSAVIDGIKILKKHGNLVVVGITGEETKVNFTGIMDRELHIIGAQAYSHWPSDGRRNLAEDRLFRRRMTCGTSYQDTFSTG